MAQAGFTSAAEAAHSRTITVPNTGQPQSVWIDFGAVNNPSATGVRAADRSGPPWIGRAVRTCEGEDPVFVTYGHRLGLDEAVELVLRLTAPDSRLPACVAAAEAALPVDGDA